MTYLIKQTHWQSVASLFIAAVAISFAVAHGANAKECANVMTRTTSATISAAGPVVFAQQPSMLAAVTQFVQESTVGPSVVVPDDTNADVEIIPVPAPEPIDVRSEGVDVIGFVKKGDLKPDGIEVEIIGSGVERTTTDENGQFRFRSMIPGQYIIRAEGPVQNYTRTATRAIELSSDVVVVELELR